LLTIGGIVFGLANFGLLIPLLDLIFGTDSAATSAGTEGAAGSVEGLRSGFQGFFENVLAETVVKGRWPWSVQGLGLRYSWPMFFGFWPRRF
jgi:hypothetical protein